MTNMSGWEYINGELRTNGGSIRCYRSDDGKIGRVTRKRSMNCTPKTAYFVWDFRKGETEYTTEEEARAAL